MQSSYIATGITVAGLLVILQLANLAINIWYRLRRQPPIDQELRQFVTRREYENFCMFNDQKISEIYTLLRHQQETISKSVNELRKDIGSWQAGIERQIGRLESKQP
ncbi:MAG: hypothetical protein ACOYH4_06560 [Saccharofermentanales bacterium]|jgi:hypothetical protein